MLRLRTHLLAAVQAPQLLLAAASLHCHHLSTATASPAPFVAEHYLVTTCGLTPAQALKSSKYLAHLKSRSKADAVLAFLAHSGLAKADVAAAIASDSRLLCCKVEQTLNPRIGMLRDIGLSPAQISSLIAIVPDIFRKPSVIRNLEFLMSFLGSYEKVHTALNRSKYFLNRDIERVVKPNIAFLQQCGLTDCDIVRIFRHCPSLIATEPEHVKEIVVCADKLGVPRDSAMFKHTLMSIYCVGPEMIGARLDLLKKHLGCSEAEVGTAVRKLPAILSSSEDRLRCLVKFLKMEVGVDAGYILARPALLTYSLKRRLIPRNYVVKVLKEKELLKNNIDFYNVVCLTEKRFAKRFLDPYKKAIPGLAAAYAEQVAPKIKPLQFEMKMFSVLCPSASAFLV